MSSHDALLAEIEAFLVRAGMSSTMFGLRTVNDGKLLKRLRGGSSVTLPTADKLRAFIAANQPEIHTKPRRRAA